MAKVLVVIPTYNEAENIDAILDAVLSQGPEVDVLVVDDNSPDGTAERVRARMERNPRIHLLVRPGKQGLGTAYVAGFRWALAHGYDHIIQMDADFSHNPEDIPRLLQMLRTHDVVIGSRYTDGINVVNWPMKRLLLSYFANIYARWVTGVPVRDLTGGFKGWRREVLEAIGLEEIASDGYAFQIEMNVKAYSLGFSVVEIPIVFVERRAGVSKMSRRIIVEALWMVWRLRFWRWFRAPARRKALKKRNTPV